MGYKFTTRVESTNKNEHNIKCWSSIASHPNRSHCVKSRKAGMWKSTLKQKYSRCSQSPTHLARLREHLQVGIHPKISVLNMKQSNCSKWNLWGEKYKKELRTPMKIIRAVLFEKCIGIKFSHYLVIPHTHPLNANIFGLGSTCWKVKVGMNK
jgi:hypothetical protein